MVHAQRPQDGEHSLNAFRGERKPHFLGQSVRTRFRTRLPYHKVFEAVRKHHCGLELVPQIIIIVWKAAKCNVLQSDELGEVKDSFRIWIELSWIEDD